MSKHTPGPWLAVKNSCFWQIDSERDGQIGDACASQFDGTGKTTPETLALAEANARLIAAAPELLAELKRLRIAYVYLLEFGRDRITALGGQCNPVDVMERADPALKAAADAIAKAEGRA